MCNDFQQADQPSCQINAFFDNNKLSESWANYFGATVSFLESLLLPPNQPKNIFCGYSIKVSLGKLLRSVLPTGWSFLPSFYEDKGLSPLVIRNTCLDLYTDRLELGPRLVRPTNTTFDIIFTPNNQLTIRF